MKKNDLIAKWLPIISSIPTSKEKFSAARILENTVLNNSTTYHRMALILATNFVHNCNLYSRKKSSSTDIVEYQETMLIWKGQFMADAFAVFMQSFAKNSHGLPAHHIFVDRVMKNNEPYIVAILKH
jgi:hypothetical protein